jgi:hypothetical protein
MRFGFRPVIIIGAPRSGTNMLRDTLVRVSGFGTWPCDEINFIWRHGNARYPTDELPPELARPEVASYVRRQFEGIARGGHHRLVVEKTCANSLRVPFVDRIVPEARYLFILRDGFDAVASACERWRGKVDVAYLARKARFIPLSDVPLYASRFLVSRLQRWRSAERRVHTWGPVFQGLEQSAANEPLALVCARQWSACVRSAHTALGALEPARVFRIQYEEFVRAPAVILGRIGAFLEVDIDEAAAHGATREIVATSVGKGRKSLSAEAVAAISPIFAAAAE